MKTHKHQKEERMEIRINKKKISEKQQQQQQ